MSLWIPSGLPVSRYDSDSTTSARLQSISELHTAIKCEGRQLTEFKFIAEDALIGLRKIIAEVDKRCAPKSQVVPMFLYGDHRRALFQCSLEYDYRDIDSQILALRKLGALMEYVSNEAGNKWGLPTGRTFTRRWHKHKAPGDDHYTAQMETIEENVLDSTLSEPEGPGGFSFSINIPPIGSIAYNQRAKPTIGVLVGYYT